MVALAIVAILAAMAVPSYRDMFDRYRLRGAVDDVTSVIATARAGAVKADRDVNVSFGSTAAGWCMGAEAALAPDAGQRRRVRSHAIAPIVRSARSAVRSFCVPPGKHAGVAISVRTDFAFDSNLGLIQSGGTA